jgi:transcriptional regulator with XRE-family HTH domain
MQDERARLLNLRIANNIKKIRLEKQFSLSDLAKRTGFTKSYLSQIENGKKEPPISTLSKIAYILEVDLPFLLTGQTQHSRPEKISIVRKAERKPSDGPFGSRGYIYDSLTYKKADRLMDGYIVTIGPDFPPKPLVHEGQELVYVLEGTQELLYDGQTYFLEEGDCFYFDSDRPHYSRTIGDKPGKILVVLTTKGGGTPGEFPEKNTKGGVKR